MESTGDRMKFDKKFDKKLLKNKTVIFFLIVLLYEMSKILLSKFNIEYRAAPARLFYWIIIIGIVITGYRLLYKANLVDYYIAVVVFLYAVNSYHCDMYSLFGEGFIFECS